MQNILIIITFIVFICYSITFLSDSKVDASPPLPDWGSPIEEQTCTPSGQVIVNIGVHPDRRYLWPDFLVDKNALVGLDGVAMRLVVHRDCTTAEIELPFTWSVLFTSPDGSRATKQLTSPGTLEPSFNANEVGKYTVRLATQFSSETVNIYAEDPFTPSGGKWISIGPDNIAGRMDAIAIHPGTRHIYAGAETGGLWRSTDSGRSWHTLSDDAVNQWGMPTIKILSLAIAGDSMQIHAGLDIWKGIWKYSPEAKIWSRSGANLQSCNNRDLSTSSVPKIVVHPMDRTKLYAATNNGVFSTTTSGVCWQKILSTNSPVDDLVITKSSPPKVYAALGGGIIYKTTDSNPTVWTLLNDQANSGLPPMPSGGRTALAASDSNPNVLYLGFDSGERYTIYKSVTSGSTWNQLPPGTGQGQLPNRCDGQCNHNNVIAVHPRDPNIVIVGQVPLYISVNGGAENSWKELGYPNAKPGPQLSHGMHSDILALLFDPFDSSKLYVGTDGGIYEQIIDIGNPRPYWTYISNELVTTQFYDSGLAPKERFLTAGGTYDNSNLLRKESKSWTGIRNSGGDGFHTEFDVTSRYNPQIVFHNSYWGGSGHNGWNIYEEKVPGEKRFITRGQTFYANPYRSTLAIFGTDGQLYHANLLREPSLVRCVDPTPGNPMDKVRSVSFLNQFSSPQDYMLVGMDDGSIYVILVADGFQGTECSSSNRIVVKIFYDPLQGCAQPTGSLNDLTPNPHQRGDIIYATYAPPEYGPGRVLRIDAKLVGDRYQLCASDITGDLPRGYDAKHIVMDPVKRDVIHLGTSQGIFIGKFIPKESRWHWSPAPGSPPVDINFLDIQQNSDRQPGVIRAATYGRGVFEWLRPRIDERSFISIQPNSSISSINQNNLSDCTVREFDDSENRNRVVAVDVDYIYNSSQGGKVGIRAIPTINGSYTPFFLTQVKELEQGSAHSNLLTRYVGENAPLLLSTDGISVEMFHPLKGVFLSKICRVDLTWKSEGARTLKVDAFRIDAEGPTEPALVPINITTADINVSTNQTGTPFEHVVKQGSKINISAPLEIRRESEAWNFSGWNVNGSTMDLNSTISIVLNGDSNVQAIYSPTAEEERPKITIRSLCNCSLENNTKTVISMLSVPINYSLGTNVEVVYTPITLGVKSDKVFLTAPEVTKIGNVTLRFMGWNVGDQKEEMNQLKPQISLTISKDTLVTAKYRLE